jgi:hypothetical protein
MANQDVANLGGVHHGVIGGQNGTAGYTENYLNTSEFQGCDQTLGSGHLGALLARFGVHLM